MNNYAKEGLKILEINFKDFAHKNKPGPKLVD